MMEPMQANRLADGILHTLEPIIRVEMSDIFVIDKRWMAQLYFPEYTEMIWIELSSRLSLEQIISDIMQKLSFQHVLN